MRKLFLVIGMSAASMFMTAQAQDTITFTWKGGINKTISVRGSQQITIKWGDGTDTIGTDFILNKNHSYVDTSIYTVQITSNGLLIGLDCFYNQVTNIDLNKCLNLDNLRCYGNQLSSLDISNTALTWLECYGNQLMLSDLYAASLKIYGQSQNVNKLLGSQNLPIRQVVVGDTIDFSSQAKFGSKNTDFFVSKNGWTAPISDYNINNGIITFYDTGDYIVVMTNTAISSYTSQPAQVVVPFTVLRKANTDATLANLTVSESILNPIFSSHILYYTVDVAYNISEITITATPNDSNAVINGDTGVQQLSVGLNNFIITVVAEDSITKQNYIVTVNRADTIVGIKQLQVTNYELQVYPNPTTNQLQITNYELRENLDYSIYSIMGQVAMQGKLQELTTINVESLAKGMYYLKIDNKIAKFIKN